MDRKLFFGMFVAAGMLLATSCSKDELDTASSGNEAQVTFSLGLEGRVATRAISDGTGANRLTYIVLDKDGNPAGKFTPTIKKNVSFPYTLTLALAKGQEYKVAFWADNSDCKAYKVNSDATVSVKYDEATNNDETRDAFFKTTDVFKVTGSTSMDVELKRPFAQINVGVTTGDWQAAVKSGVTITQSSAIIGNAATTLDLVTGAASGSAEVSYSFADIPVETLQVDENKDGNISSSEKYKWLSMGYILVNDGSEENPSTDGTAKAVLEKLEFTFKPEQGNDIVFGGLNNVPVQRNWRTNILGKLLTGDVEFNITIDPTYNGDYIYPDGGVQELEMAAANGGTVKLTEDVVLQEPLKIAAGKSVVINLNGKTITPPTGADRTIQVQDGAELEINGDGTIGSLDDGALAVCVMGGKLTINGGTYYGGSGCSCIYLFNSSKYDGVQNKGSIEINGGSFKVNAPWTNGFYYVLNKQNGAEGTITVKGGTFENYDPAQGDDHDQPTNFVADGYTSIKTSEDPVTYEVVKGSDVTSADNFEDAFASGVVTVSQDLAIDGGYVNNVESAVLQLKSGATLSRSDEGAQQCIMVSSGCDNMTINGNGTILGPTNSTHNTAAIWTSSPNLVIEGDVTVDGGKESKDANFAVYIANGTTTIKGGRFKVGLAADGSANSCIYLHPQRTNYKPKLYIYGGVFETEGNLNGWYPVININDGYRNKCTVQIYGGIFVNYNPATGDNTGEEGDTFVAPGYKSVETTYEGKTAWEVIPE